MGITGFEAIVVEYDDESSVAFVVAGRDYSSGHGGADGIARAHGYVYSEMHSVESVAIAEGR